MFIRRLNYTLDLCKYIESITNFGYVKCVVTDLKNKSVEVILSIVIKVCTRRLVTVDEFIYFNFIYFLFYYFLFVTTIFSFLFMLFDK